MAQPVNFCREKAEYLLKCIQDGLDLKCPPGGWSKDEMLAVAGAMYFACMSQGPLLHEGVEVTTLSGERQEALWATLVADLHAAIETYGRLTMRVCDDQYDDAFEPRVLASVESEAATHKMTILFLKGAKGEELP